MEEDQDRQEQQSSESMHKNDRSLRDTFRSGSPDDVRDKVKEVVEKGVAAVAGALRGFSEKAEKEHISDTTKSALHQAGETARNTVSGVTEEAKSLKQPLQEAGQKLRETARDVRSSVRSEVDSTRSALRESGSSEGSALGSERGSSPYSGIGSTHEGGGSYGTSMGMGGSSLERKESEFPDIRNTPMAESDRKLAGKDLTKDLEEE